MSERGGGSRAKRTRCRFKRGLYSAKPLELGDAGRHGRAIEVLINSDGLLNLPMSLDVTSAGLARSVAQSFARIQRRGRDEARRKKKLLE